MEFRFIRRNSPDWLCDLISSQWSCWKTGDKFSCWASPEIKKPKSDPDHIGGFAYEEMSLIKGCGVTEVINFCTNALKSTCRQDNPCLSFIPLELFLKELRNNIAWVRQTDFTASHKGIEKFKQQRRLTQRKFLKTTALFERQESVPRTLIVLWLTIKNNNAKLNQILGASTREKHIINISFSSIISKPLEIIQLNDISTIGGFHLTS